MIDGWKKIEFDAKLFLSLSSPDTGKIIYLPKELIEENGGAYFDVYENESGIALGNGDSIKAYRTARGEYRIANSRFYDIIRGKYPGSMKFILDRRAWVQEDTIVDDTITVPSDEVDPGFSVDPDKEIEKQKIVLWVLVPREDVSNG